MTEPREDPEINTDVIRQMRLLARRGTTVRELVHTVQVGLGLKSDAVLLPALWYITRAFYLTLPAVLPIREWLGTTQDEEINALILPAIEQTRARWMAELATAYNGTTGTAATDPGAAAREHRS